MSVFQRWRVFYFPENMVVTTRLTDMGEQPVEIATHKNRTDDVDRGIIVYGYKFRPVLIH